MTTTIAVSAAQHQGWMLPLNHPGYEDMTAFDVANAIKTWGDEQLTKLLKIIVVRSWSNFYRLPLLADSCGWQRLQKIWSNVAQEVPARADFKWIAYNPVLDADNEHLAHIARAMAAAETFPAPPVVRRIEVVFH